MVAIVLALVLFVGACNGAPSPSRLIGGSPTNVIQHPSIVQVNLFDTFTNYWQHWSGGTILTQDVVISAAHVLREHLPAVHSIRAGATIRNSGGVLVYVSSILIHPYYRNHLIAADGDIGLVRLGSKLNFGSTINAISIPPQEFLVPGNSPGIYVGWGDTLDILQQVVVNILSHDECERRHGQRVNRDVVCAGDFDRDACAGDVGGPLYFGGVLVGTISLFRCGHPTIPTTAIRTAAYTDWIVANV